MYQFIMLIHVFTAVGLILLVMIQQGKGAATGAAFGSGASQTVFGSRGSGSFLLKVTIGFGVVFFSTSIALNYIATKAAKQATQQDFMLPPVKQQGNVLPALPPLPAGSAPTSTPIERSVPPVSVDKKVEKNQSKN